MKIIDKFRPAISGIIKTFKEESSFKIEVALGLLALTMSFYFHIKVYEWLVILVLIGMVLSLELINTALENLCDKVEKQEDLLIKQVKDGASGAVLVVAIVAFIIGLIIFIPYIKEVI